LDALQAEDFIAQSSIGCEGDPLISPGKIYTFFCWCDCLVDLCSPEGKQIILDGAGDTIQVISGWGASAVLNPHQAGEQGIWSCICSLQGTQSVSTELIENINCK